MKVQILDADYKIINSKPVIRIFGKQEDGTPVCVFDENYDPYFYALPEEGKEQEVIDTLTEEYSGEIKNVEKVEKYLPLTYDPNKKDLLKIETRIPKSVPEVSDFLKNDAPVKNVYENDILFKYRYLVDKGVGGMYWVDVEGKPVDTDTVDCKAIQAEKVEAIDKEKNAPLRYFSFDIECIAQEEGRMVDAEKDPVIMISCSFKPDYRGENDIVLVAKPGDTDAEHFQGEEEMLQRFVEIIDDFDPDIITGYNAKDFDVPYILTRLKKYDMQRDIGRCEKNAYCNKYGNSTDVNITGRVMADVYEIVKKDVYLRLMRYDLDTVGEQLLGENKEDVEYEEMKKLWNGNQEQLQRFVDYCRQDARLTLNLLIKKNLLDKFFELSKVSGLLLGDSMGGQTQRISNRLLKEFNKEGFVFPSKPDEEEMKRRNEKRKKEALKGGLVLEPEKGLHTDSCITVLDFKSLYPSIMSTYNICPTTLLLDDPEEYDLEEDDYHVTPSGDKFVKRDKRKGVLARVVEELIDSRTEIKKERAKAKEEGKDELYEQLDAKQLAVKIMTNSFYGYTGYYRTRLYRLAIANSITAYGRKTIEKTEEMVEDEFGRDVVYGDTDSVMVRADTKNLDEAHQMAADICDYVTDELPGRLILEPEKVYRSFLILTKKRYAGWAHEPSGDGWEDKIDMKGIETVRRDWPEIVSNTMSEVIDIILKEGDINKAIDHVKEVVDKIANREVPLEKLQVVKGITKKLDNYDGVLPHIEMAKRMKNRNPSNPPTPGDRLPYVIIKGNQMLSKRAEHPDYIKEKGLESDSEYYINSQLLPPLERIFNVIGVDKEEILGNGRQTSLGETLNGDDVDRKRDVSIETSPRETVVEDLNGFTCEDCGKEYRRIPLKGKCDCGGELFCQGNGSIGKKVKIEN
ncbi:MAG: family B DNA polymerase [Candidatus Aenigmatarchaeota archaeon]